MAVIKKIVALVAIAALIYFAPQIGAKIASGFLASLIGTVIVAAGVFIISALLLTPNAPSAESAKVNVRIPDPPRWLNCGRARSGGSAMFGEYDEQGRFWYIIVHSDEILDLSNYSHFLDDVAVTLDASHYVVQKEFRLKTNKDKDPAEYDGQGKGYVRIWTTTYSETNPTPARITALDAEFPNKWTSDHKLVGTTFSVICIDALKIEDRYKIFRWRGPFGMGEPAVNVLGDWANVYDPRDPDQVLGDRTTYKPSRNAALVWAWFRTHKYGRKKPEASIDWDRIAEQADICDQAIVGIESTQPRYECAASIVDSKARADGEKDILLSMDGIILFGEDGKSWCSAGYYTAPTLSFSRNRDIMAMSSMEAQDGESATQGVIVNYLEPAANYTKQPSAAWLNPIYYDPTKTPQFLTVDVEACTNHNQAMRIAKGIGMRSQPRHKLGPTVNLRGLRARQERIIDIQYDNVSFFGGYEIATPVEMDAAGIMTGFGAVPIDASRWTLLPGEEQPRPVVSDIGVYDKVSDLPTVSSTDNGTYARVTNDPTPSNNTLWIVYGGAWVIASTVTFPAIVGATASYSDGALRVDFPDPPRADGTYLAEYILTSLITGSDSDPWVPMSINVDTATSGSVPTGDSYTIRYRYVVSSGQGPGWQYAVVTPVDVLPSSTNLTVDVSTPGQAVVTWKNPNDLRFFSTDIWRGTDTNFAHATKIVDSYGGGVGQVQSITDTVTAGAYYWWAVATDGASLEADPTGPVAGTVT